MLVINNLNKTYSTKSNETINALNNINLSFIKKEMVFIIGQSGSGKTTLLNMLGGLDIPTNGEIVVDNKILGKDLSLELYRQNYIGFVFQEYNLIDGLSVFDNIALVINASKEETINKVKEVLDKVELSGFEKRRINELSGGQKQRVAIARALAKECEILLCDEPTGNLDSKTSIEIFELLKKISKEKNVIIVSHNEELANKYSDRIIKISDGNIILDQVNNNQNNNDDLDKPIIQNHVTLRYKLKIGFHNLFLKKFKTVISFLLLFLSMFTLCAMQITLSYNSERNIVKTLGDTEDIIVMKNNNENSITNENPNSPLFNTLNKYVDSSNITNIYPTIYGNFFLGECNKEFYKKGGCKKIN